MSLAYGIIALISLCMVGICVAADKKRDVWLLLVFVSVSVCNLGYFMLSVSPNLSSALNANRIAYLGILVFWGISVYDRVVNKNIRRYLIILVVLIMFRMLVRTLRRRIESAAGRMTVQSLPYFQLTVTVPKGKAGVL